MKESLEELKAIRDGAPDGATHVDGDNLYLKCDSEHYWHAYASIVGEWSSVDDDEFGCYTDIRSLSDINRIIELMEFIDEVGLDLMLELRGKVSDNSDERINQIARNGGDGEHYD